MYSHIFSSIPILENDNIILRLPERNDILEIHTLLNEKDIFLNYAEENQDYKDIDKIENIFIIQPHYYFQKKELVTFVIVDKKTKKVIGLREIHFDAGDSHVTIQGFIGLNHSLKGISKEAYYLIIDFLIKNNVKGIKANTFFENFAAVSLLNSIGFKTIKVYNLCSSR